MHTLPPKVQRVTPLGLHCTSLLWAFSSEVITTLNRHYHQLLFLIAAAQLNSNKTCSCISPKYLTELWLLLDFRHHRKRVFYSYCKLNILGDWTQVYKCSTTRFRYKFGSSNFCVIKISATYFQQTWRWHWSLQVGLVAQQMLLWNLPAGIKSLPVFPSSKSVTLLLRLWNPQIWEATHYILSPGLGEKKTNSLIFSHKTETHMREW